MKSKEDFSNLLDLRILYYQELTKSLSVCDDSMYVGEVYGALEELYYIKDIITEEK